MFLLAAEVPGQSHGEALSATVNAAVAAERAAFDDVWFAEHQIMSSGVCPSAAALAGLCRARTRAGWMTWGSTLVGHVSPTPVFDLRPPDWLVRVARLERGVQGSVLATSDPPAGLGQRRDLGGMGGVRGESDAWPRSLNSLHHRPAAAITRPLTVQRTDRRSGSPTAPPGCRAALLRGSPTGVLCPTEKVDAVEKILCVNGVLTQTISCSRPNATLASLRPRSAQDGGSRYFGEGTGGEGHVVVGSGVSPVWLPGFGDG